MVTDAQIRTAIVNKIKGFDPTAKVHRRRRFPREERIEEYKEIYSGADDTINCYMLRRLRRIPLVKGIPARLVSVTTVYEIRFYLALVDSEDDSAASEEIAQGQIDALAAEFEEDRTLGLGHSLTHEGLQMPSDFEDVLLGDWAAHRAILLIETTAMNC